jgi:hypothetical protein
MTRNFVSNFLLQLALPLKREIRRAHDQDSLGQAAQLELADEKAGHDGLASTGVVGSLRMRQLSRPPHVPVDRL